MAVPILPDQPTTFPFFLKLPYDLQVQICGLFCAHCRNDPPPLVIYEDDMWDKPLRALSQTCRAVKDIAQPMYFHCPYTRRHGQFIRHMRRYAHLAQHVRVFADHKAALVEKLGTQLHQRIGYTLSQTAAGDKIPYTAIRNFLKKCTSLQKVSFSHEDPGLWKEEGSLLFYPKQAINTLSPVAATLERLVLFCGHSMIPNLAQSSLLTDELHAFTRLTVLDLDEQNVVSFVGRGTVPGRGQ
ncbi:hypothetical protein VHEMI06174 [[Torrubiella] hemipterigena]|uniref:F-box domain-containing protein n=1 Tax=[Torrubiella] hemipterigena TaxID=1531966 RepID=A0A0A1SZW5_9HYPO|nr:hypothetical protein VHEMI06174 [[Torrubiella] hemipterigena]